MRKAKYIFYSLAIGIIFILFSHAFDELWINMDSLYQDYLSKFHGEVYETRSLSSNEGSVEILDKNEKSYFSDIVFVNIDEKSLNKIGKWPWERDIYKKFIHQIEKLNPELVLLDIYFPEISKKDEVFANALKKYENIGTVYNFLSDYEVPLDKKTKNNIRKWTLKTNRKDTLKGIKSILPTVDPISAHSYLGHDYIIKDLDDTYRKIPEYVIFNGYLYPSITSILYMKYNNLSMSDLKLKDDDLVIGDKRIPLNSNGCRHIDFFITPENRDNFRNLSFYDILKGEVKLNLKNKIVMVGITAKGIASAAQDIKLTPVGELFGIEYLANSLINIFENRFLYEIPTWSTHIGFLLLIILLSFFNYKYKGWKNILIIFFFLLFLLLGGYYIYVKWGILLKISRLIVGIVLMYFIMTFHNYIVEEKEKNRIRGMFSSYVSENVVKQIIKNPDLAKLHGQKRNMSVLFSDIKSFTTFTENNDSRYVVNRLNEFLEAMVNVIVKNQGTLDKFVGDEIVAIFGAPIEIEHHADLAVKTALDMRLKLKDLRKKWDRNNQKHFEIGIGINSGPMLVGNIGAEGKKMDYTVIGDNVNLAARVEGLTRFYKADIIINENTYNQLIEYKENTRMIDIVQVKGKAIPTKIYEVKSNGFEKQHLNIFTKAREYYENMNWEKAAAVFEKLLNKYPEDKVAKIYLDRIKKFRQNPPDNNWNGIFILDKK